MSIETRLARPDPRYATGIFAYSRNPAFFRYLDAQPMSTVGDAEAFIAELRRENDRGLRDYFLIVDGRTEQAIGTIGFLFLYPRRHRIADLGYGLSQEYWGSGAFQSAGRQIIDYGFDQLDLARIQVTTRADNVRAIRGVEKLGFRSEAILRGFYQTQEGRVDGMLLGLLKQQQID